MVGDPQREHNRQSAIENRQSLAPSGAVDYLVCSLPAIEMVGYTNANTIANQQSKIANSAPPKGPWMVLFGWMG